MQTEKLIFLIVLICIFAVQPPVLARDIDFSGNASYWDGSLWAGVSARARVTENLSARVSFSTRTGGIYRISAAGTYEFKISEEINPYLGAGAGYSTHRDFNIDLIAGARIVFSPSFRFHGEATYTIFLNEAYSPRPGFRLSMGGSL